MTTGGTKGNCRQCNGSPLLNETIIAGLMALELSAAQLERLAFVQCDCVGVGNWICQACFSPADKPPSAKSTAKSVDEPSCSHCPALRRWCVAQLLESCERVWNSAVKLGGSSNSVDNMDFVIVPKTDPAAKMPPKKKAKHTPQPKPVAVGNGIGYGCARSQPSSVFKLDHRIDEKIDSQAAWLFQQFLQFLPRSDGRTLTEFDMEPPRRFLRMLTNGSGWLRLLSSYLRNDSVAEWSSRHLVFDSALDLVQRLLGHSSLLKMLTDPIPADSGNRDDETTCLRDLLKTLNAQSQVFLMQPLSSSNSSVDKSGNAIASRISKLALQLEKAVDSSDVCLIVESQVDSYSAALTPLLFAFVDLKNPKTGSYDHSYSKEISKAANRTAKGTMYIAKEIASLSTSLPVNDCTSIFVRVDNDRYDVIKALITGPKGTPYENGAFEFDIFMPSQYPTVPPKVLLRTTGNGRVRFNPNLYNCGKVCLSLLGTWQGDATEQWRPNESTLLQVLLSIQSMILCDYPYFNEPGFGQLNPLNAQSIAYNKDIMLETMRVAIMEQLRQKKDWIWTDVVRKHFQMKKQEISEQFATWKTACPQLKPFEAALKQAFSDL